ncbi:MAG: hypothetical protein FWH32_00795 [Clostridiales bacterium]|nr:hypothetical protein [Clostridiales bacterium]
MSVRHGYAVSDLRDVQLLRFCVVFLQPTDGRLDLRDVFEKLGEPF